MPLKIDSLTPGAGAGAGKKKNNKKKNKNNANKQKPVAEIEKGDAVEEQPKQQPDEQPEREPEPEQEDASADEPETPVVEETPRQGEPPPQPTSQPESKPDTNGHATAAITNGHNHPPQPTAEPSDDSSSSTTAKLEAMSAEREALRQEVEQLRRQLETLSASHTEEVSQLRTDLEESEAAKDQAETQYQNLLGRVEKIKEVMGDRLKRDKAELEEASQRVEELEATNEELKNTNDDLKSGRRALEEEVERLKEEMAEQGRELGGLRSRSNLSQQNWLKEKDDLAQQTAHLKQELEATAAAMGEWEVIAMEERSMRESLSDKVADLEEQVSSQREAYERAVSERDTHSQAVDGLQRALQEIQEARKRELREMVETSESQVAELKKRAQEAEGKAAKAEAEKETLEKELERTVPFEREVKEKNLLIGKLRHEGIVLNDHLIKALKYIKKMKPEESIDRQIVTNHLIQFLSLDRSDPRKFQILQVMAGLLDWTEEQREKVGLARPGGASNTLRLPQSPFHRTPSSPALNTEFFTETASTPAAGRQESLADLWAGFLEKSVEEASAGGSNASGSRKGSVSSLSTTTTARPDTSGGQ
ncbi:hypothetical protein GE09DRAFT_1048897 [Coniochaeta sp. 2T2.1]|nr:hypothetical protein GE09DRAFT_1048897 [Coniochaeta sp. 2T2.1]